ncbi:MAG: superoxide dismutase [Candidatus Micrarchaeota archaeon]
MTFELPKLPYAYNALEPYMDEQTMRIHHDKHHQAYLEKTNSLLVGRKELENKSIEEILSNLEKIPADIRTALKNQGGGYANHSLFWEFMAPNAGGKPKGELAKKIDETFGTFQEFQKKFSEVALNQFGSGWAWLALNRGKLEVFNLPNQDSPWSVGKKPLLCLDVWEHSYYLLYNQRRADYVNAWWNIVNWKKAEELFQKAK